MNMKVSKIIKNMTGDGESAMRYCRFCGNEITADSLFCSACGKKLITEQEITMNDDVVAKYDNLDERQHFAKKDKTIALLLCVFGGFVGAHRFYLSNTKGGFKIVLLFFLWLCLDSMFDAASIHGRDIYMLNGSRVALENSNFFKGLDMAVTLGIIVIYGRELFMFEKQYHKANR